MRISVGLMLGSGCYAHEVIILTGEDKDEGIAIGRLVRITCEAGGCVQSYVTPGEQPMHDMRGSRPAPPL
jgi:hypothetical protein